MTSKPVKYAYTLHNPRSVPNGTIDTAKATYCQLWEGAGA